MRPFAALLLDLDGTLIDSTRATEAAWSAWARDHGVEDPEAFARGCHGIPSVEYIAEHVPDVDAVAEAERIERLQAESTEPTPAFDGAAEVLAFTTAAIVTSGTRPLAEARLRNAGLTPPAVIVFGGEAARGKPSPDPYLLGASRLGVDPADCLVVEDAPAGIAAGHAAGCQVAAVGHTHGCADLDAECFATLRELLEALRAAG